MKIEITKLSDTQSKIKIDDTQIAIISNKAMVEGSITSKTITIIPIGGAYNLPMMVNIPLDNIVINGMNHRNVESACAELAYLVNFSTAGGAASSTQRPNGTLEVNSYQFDAQKYVYIKMTLDESNLPYVNDLIQIDNLAEGLTVVDIKNTVSKEMHLVLPEDWLDNGMSGNERTLMIQPYLAYKLMITKAADKVVASLYWNATDLIIYAKNIEVFEAKSGVNLKIELNDVLTEDMNMNVLVKASNGITYASDLFVLRAGKQNYAVTITVPSSSQQYFVAGAEVERINANTISILQLTVEKLNRYIQEAPVNNITLHTPHVPVGGKVNIEFEHPVKDEIRAMIEVMYKYKNRDGSTETESMFLTGKLYEGDRTLSYIEEFMPPYEVENNKGSVISIEFEPKFDGEYTYNNWR